MNNSKSSGITFAGLLTVSFIVLKLCKVIDWPWVWVISPVWISCALILIASIVIFIVGLWHDV